MFVAVHVDEGDWLARRGNGAFELRTDVMAPPFVCTHNCAVAVPGRNYGCRTEKKRARGLWRSTTSTGMRRLGTPVQPAKSVRGRGGRTGEQRC